MQIRIKAEVDVVELTEGDIGPYTFNNTLKFEEAKKYNKELQQIISRSRNPKLDRAFEVERNNEDTLGSEDALILKEMVSDQILVSFTASFVSKRRDGKLSIVVGWALK